MPILIIRSVNPGTIGKDGPSRVGHAWIEISGPANSPTGGAESYGYYPEELSSFPVPWSKPGEVRTRDMNNYSGMRESKSLCAQTIGL